MNDVKEIISFPTDLSENNDKEWFHATPSINLYVQLKL